MLTCSNCGNSRGWTNVRQSAEGGQEATCASCGHREVRRGGVTVQSAGSMDQTVAPRKKKR